MNDAKKKKLERTRESIKVSAGDLKSPSSQLNKTFKPAASIGIYLQRFETQEPFCASDRIRGEWIIKHSPKMEIFDPKKNYDVVIFHIACTAIAQYGRIKILDICDKVWEQNIDQFLTLIDPIDAIIVPTEELKNELANITSKDIHVIGDGHDFSHYIGSVHNPHTEEAKEVVWFGYADNAGCLQPVINYIKSSGLKLKVITQHQGVEPLQHADKFVKWDLKTYLPEIAKSDFAILPPNQHYKSDNKEITALLCGIPVAKTKEDISRLINPAERKLQLTERMKDIAKYNVRNRTQEYLKVIEGIKKVDVVRTYSAISGKYEKPRNDIQIFTDQASDIFKMPVMNAKIYKILSHKYFSSNFTVYVDGNIFLNVPPTKLLSELLKDADIALFNHPWRKCLYQEFEHARRRVLHFQQPLMDEQVKNYRAEGMPENFGLGECGMLIRRNNEATAEFNERWWAEICRYTNRDQMSFPYVLWKMKNRIKVNFLEGNVREHSFFRYVNHGK